MKSIFAATCLVLFATLPVAHAQTASSAPSLRCADFQRNADGSWVTQRQTVVPYPNAQVSFAPNTAVPAADHTYMGMRLGRMLDEQCSAGRR